MMEKGKTEEVVKMRDIAPFGLRITKDLRGLLENAARTNRRSLNGEILVRLRHSFDSDGQSSSEADGTLFPEKLHSDTERAILERYRAMPPDKQLALLTLLRNFPSE